MRISFVGMLTGLALLTAPSLNAQVITGFEEFTGAGNGTVLFRQPTFSGSTGGNLNPAGSNTAQVSTDLAFSGLNSMKVEFDWVDNAPTRWLRLSTFNAASLPNPIIDFTQALTMKVYVASDDPLGFVLGVRETNSTGVIGANGGAAGSIEFVGSTTNAPPTPTPTRVLAPGAWHDLSFVIPSEPMGSLTGNGILQTTTGKGVLEHLGIRSTGAGTHVKLYVDDIRVVSPNAIPEPGTLALLAGGLLPLLGIRRRK